MEIDFLGRTICGGDLDPSTQEWLELHHDLPVADGASNATLSALVPSGYVVHVDVRDQPVPADVECRDGTAGQRGTRHIAIDSDEFWILEGIGGGVGGVHGRLTDHDAVLEMYGTPSPTRVALQEALAESMASSGMVLVHAAAIHDGVHTLAMLGTSGRGKSTTLVRAALQGWSPMADDGCWLDLRSRTLVGADRRLRLTAESLVLLDGVEPRHRLGLAADGKHEIDYESLGGRIRSAPLTHLVHMERSEDPEPEWRSLDQARAVMALHQAVGIANTGRVGERLASGFAGLVRALACLTLRLGLPTSPIPPLPPPWV